MTDPTLLVLDADPPPRLGRLTGRARIAHTDEAQLAARLPTADVLLVWDFTSHAVREAWPGEGPRPRWVHTASAGVDHLMCPELAASDTVVTNARGVFEQPIAEYVAALVLAMAKDLPRTWELQRRGEWRHRESQRVAGTRAVVVGTGPVGRAVARVLRPWTSARRSSGAGRAPGSTDRRTWTGCCRAPTGWSRRPRSPTTRAACSTPAASGCSSRRPGS
ncbi:hypothetical protein SGLAM104S_00585 [Streptomyces glaucescens]